ncbi:MgtC/SapB family protein, partial [Oxalobacteraceae bacterium]|nr:MgtC/SapB family protein [Oxalobacteraceae bacterium]
MAGRIAGMTFSADYLTGLGVALGCGLLIGAERERSKGSGPTRAFVGVRSFTLVAVTGALAQCLSATLVALGATLVLALCVLSHWRDRSDDPGVTTELALFFTYLLGVNAPGQPSVSAGAAVVLAALLNLRGPLHHFIRVSLRSGELRDALILAGAALVVWPLLPDSANGWLLGANPRRMWGLVLLIMSLQAAAHIALRLAGPRMGMGMALTGLASGFVSSTATTAAMGQRSRDHPSLLGLCAAAALLSNLATYLLLAVVVLTIAPDQWRHLAPMLGSAALATLAVAGRRLYTAPAARPRMARDGRAFRLGQALAFAAVLGGATALVAYAHTYLGPGAAVLGAMLAALIDVHA